MEVCKGKSTTDESDMGIFDTDTVFTVPGTGRNSHITMEGSEHISIGNAKVRPSRWRYLAAVHRHVSHVLIIDTISQILLLGTFKAANADDTE